MFLAMFGFFMAVAYDAPFWVYLLGLLAIIIDIGME